MAATIQHPRQDLPPTPTPVAVEFDPTPSPGPGLSLEARIGKNFAGWIGAIVLVLGVGFFLKYAWQHQWINPSPAARVTFTALAGFALAGVGEWLLRKPMRGLAAVLYAAGVAVTMTGCFAAHAYFSPPVLTQIPAALLVLATAAGGIALALRANLPAMAILSLLGAYLSPVILRPAADPSATLIPYLLLLAATGWTLCLIRPHWHALRAFTFSANAVSYFLWSFSLGQRHDHTALAFLYLVTTFAGTLAELVLTLQRQLRDTPQSPLPAGTPLAHLERSLSLLSLSNTLFTASAFYFLFRTNQPLAGTLALALAAIQGLVALATFSRQLRYSALLQSTALATLAVPLLLSRFAINLAWLVMAISLSVLGRRLDLRWSRAWSTALWALTVAKLLTLDLLSPALRATLLTVGDRPVTHWLAIAWSAALAAHALAYLGRRNALPTDRPGATLAAAGTVLFLLATALAWRPGGAFTLAGLLWLTALVGLRQQGGRVGYAAHAWILLCFLSAKWLLIDGLVPTLNAWTARPAGTLPFINLTTLCALLLAGLFAWTRTLTTNRNTKTFCTLAVCAIAFAVANFETWRLVNFSAATWTTHQLVTVKQSALCALWAATSLITATAARRPQWRFLRGVATTLFVAALARVVLFAADPALREPLAHLGPHAVSRWLLMMTVAALAAHTLAWLTADRGRTTSPDPSAAALAGLGTLTCMAAPVGSWGFDPATTLAGLAWLTPIALLSTRATRLNYTHHACVLAVALACKWLLADGLAPALLAYTNPAADTHLPLVNLPTLSALLLATAFRFLGRRPTADSHPTTGVPAKTLATIACLLVAFSLLNFELLRTVHHLATTDSPAEMRIAKQVSLSILWSLTALSAITVGFSRHLSPARYAGLALLGLTLLKVLTVDMAGAQTIWRILSFTAVGALLMCVSFVYYKHLESKPVTP